MKNALVIMVILATILGSMVCQAAFCGSDGFLHGWTGPTAIPCNHQRSTYSEAILIESSGFGIWMNTDDAKKSLKENAEAYCLIPGAHSHLLAVRTSKIETEFFFDGVNKYRLKAYFRCESPSDTDQ